MPLLSIGRESRKTEGDLELSLLRGDQDYWVDRQAWQRSVLLDPSRRTGSTNSDSVHKECGSAMCDSIWTPPWKSRKHPVFEDKWACSSGCLLAMIRNAVAREMSDGRRDGLEVQHQHRVPLGLVMLAQGWITHPQLQKALESQREQGSGRIGDLLVSECGLEPEWITRGLSVQWGCPVLTTDGFSPDAMAMALPKVFIERYGILPLRIAGTRTLYVGFEDRLDASSAYAVEQMSGLRTESGMVSETRFKEARERLLGCEFAKLTRRAVSSRAELESEVAEVIEQEHPVASRLVRLRNYHWLRVWTERGRSARGGGNLPVKSDVADFLFTIGAGPGLGIAGMGRIER